MCGVMPVSVSFVFLSLCICLVSLYVRLFACACVLSERVLNWCEPIERHVTHRAQVPTGVTDRHNR